MPVDLHTHILPGVDDGAHCLDDAVEMARMAVSSGIHTLVATPHYRYYGHDNQAQILDACKRLEDALVYHQIPLQLALAAEVWITGDDCPTITPEMTYPGTNWFLAEFPVDMHPETMHKLLGRYAEAGFLPVIAHPERYLALQEDPIIARSWVEQGWGVQLNRDSLLGLFGKSCYWCADFMLRQGWANLIASDAHWVNRRNTDWTDAWETLHTQYGSRRIEQCVEYNPSRILQGQPLSL